MTAGSPNDTNRNDVLVSVVAPVYNEATVVEELVRRIHAACATLEEPFEIIIADDCSTDETPQLLAKLGSDTALSELRHERLPENSGQWGATSYGMRKARGEVVVTIDGDLQDPPETIADMVRALRADPELDAVFACKTRRDDPAWFIAGMIVFRFIQDSLSPVALPAGAGAYVAMRRDVARRAAAAPYRMVNLAPVLCSLGVRSGSVPYEKLARYDNESRVGPVGLLQEAVGSLAVTGALKRLGWICAVLAAGAMSAVWLVS